MTLSTHNFNFHRLQNACLDATSPLPTAEELALIPDGYFRLDENGNPIRKKGNQLIPFFTQVNLGENTHTRSVEPPENPKIGDTWDELDNFKIYLNTWAWNGIFWVSTSYHQEVVLANNLFSSNFYANNQFSFANNYNLLLKQIRIIGRIEGGTSPGGEPNSDDNYWNFRFNQMIGGSGAVDFPNSPTLTTKGRTYRGAYRNLFLTSSPINTLFRVAMFGDEPDDSSEHPRGFSLLGDRINNPPNVVAMTAIFTCQFARS